MRQPEPRADTSQPGPHTGARMTMVSRRWQIRGPVLSAKTFMSRQGWLPYALIAPAVVLMFAITVFPTGIALSSSLTSLNLLNIEGSKFVGLTNYLHLLSDNVLSNSVVGSIRYTFVVMAAQLVLATATAVYLNQHFPFRGVLRSIVLLPYVVPSAVVAVIWIYVFDANFGVANDLLVRLGILHQGVPWLADGRLSVVVVLIATVWNGMPLMALILLAALQSIPEDVVEAAIMDGAGAWQRFWRITLPYLMPTIFLLLLLRTMWLTHYVDLIYLITNGGPGFANYTVAVYTYLLTSVEFRVGYAGSIAVVLSLFLLILAVIYMRQIERSREDL
jgi:multiple sugar transport system permease protein